MPPQVEAPGPVDGNATVRLGAVPPTVKLPEPVLDNPVTTRFPLSYDVAAYNAPPIPTPPVTTNAPVVVFVLAVLLVKVVAPLAVNVVNAAVPGVTLPIANDCNDAEVPVFKVYVVLDVRDVNAPDPGVTLPIAATCNPPPVAVLNVNAPVKFNPDCNVVVPVTVSAPFTVLDTEVKLPTFTFDQPLLLIDPVVVPVSVVAIAIHAASDSLHTNAVLTDP